MAQELLNETEIHGFSVRPWNFRQIQRAAPHLAIVFAKMDEAKVDFSDFEKKEGGAVAFARLGRFICTVMPQITEILKISTGAKSEQLEELTPAAVLDLCQAIVFLNLGLIKNSEAPTEEPEPTRG